jgi:Domain of unknown function (DUF6484)
MQRMDDPFLALTAEALVDDFSMLEQRPVSSASTSAPAAGAVLHMPAIGRLHGFDLQEQALVTGLDASPGEVLTARSTVPLRRSMLGRSVLVLFEQGQPRQPIIIGVIEPRPLHQDAAASMSPVVSLQVDGDRRVIEAEREIVLRCGDASITLTRAGKVIIQGNYVLSRSSGYNKIKGAAIDIN